MVGPQQWKKALRRVRGVVGLYRRKGTADRRAGGIRLLFLTPLLSLSILVPTGAAGAGSGNDAGATVTVELRYLTNRQRDARAVDVDAYGGARGAPQYGRCSAEFRPIEALGRLASRLPFYVPSERRKVVAATPEAESAFWSRLAARLDGTQVPVAVFVHGYSNSFTRTCRMAAELQRSLGERAVVLMFSWPSNGRPTDYVSDQADVEWSAPLLAGFLREIGARFGPSRVQLVAHSLGSRGSIQALQHLAVAGPEPPLLARLVLLAPDFDAQTFEGLLPQLRPLVGGITLYASDNDTPLRVSEELHGYPRLGQAGPHLTVVDGVETVDVTPAGLYQPLGHEYFYYHPSVSADLAEHIATGAGAADRSGLQQRRRGSAVYWEVLPPSGGE